MITHRTMLKWLHWLSALLLMYFLLIEPEDNRSDPGLALSTHAGMGVLLAIVTATWLLVYWRKGLAGRPGPKLPGWARPVHQLSHRALQIGLPVVVLTGALAGLTAPFAIRAFGVVQINPGIAPRGLHKLAEDIHEIAFDALLVLIVAHIVFHLWRHFLVRDNALRIMVPKALHKYL
ncbi:cytochrome b/b6 domain-containing protein [Aliisedimentitalea scapharcae]|uniref:Cytochrome b/b6 domain-containing protein n=1 Tax=Aliisedimentitalea scapharcae TaxID=1524259 RepID=A0ABZ2XY70_9RHOB